MAHRASVRQLMIGSALVLALVLLAWSGTFGEAGMGDGPTWTGLRGALAIALVSLGLIYRENGRLHLGHSSSLLGRGALIAALFVIGVPAALESLDQGLAASEIALIGSLVGLWSLAIGCRVRADRPGARGVPRISGRLMLFILVTLWMVLATIPLPLWAVGVLQAITALMWAGAGLKIITLGFDVDDEVVITLGIACVGIAASQLLTLDGARNLGAEILALGSVSFAIATAYLELSEGVKAQRGSLDATRDRMRDLAHEARTAITAIEATLAGLDRPGATDPEDRNALRSALSLELQSLRMILTRDEPETVQSLRLGDLLPPLMATSGGSVRWLVPTHIEARFAKGALIEIVQCLIDNGRVHSGGSNIDLEVDLIGDTIEIRVIDDGVGVHPSLVPRLFERGAKRRGSPGRGLGLNIAQNLAHAHGGELDYRMNFDGGSCFVLTVPSNGRVLDLSIYEDDEVVEPVDRDGPAAQPPPSDRDRRNTTLPWESHRHRGPEAGGEVAGV